MHSPPEQTPEVAAAAGLAAGERLARKRSSGGKEQWYKLQPTPNDEDSWKKLLLAEGFDGLEDGRLTRLAVNAARFQRAAGALREVAQEDGYLATMSESKFFQIIVSYACPCTAAAASGGCAQPAASGQEKPRKLSDLQPVAPKSSRLSVNTGFPQDAPPERGPEGRGPVMSKRQFVCNSLRDSATLGMHRQSSSGAAGACAPSGPRTRTSSRRLSSAESACSRRTSGAGSSAGPSRRSSLEDGGVRAGEVAQHPFVKLVHERHGTDLVDAAKALLGMQSSGLSMEAPIEGSSITPLFYSIVVAENPALVKLLVDHRADVQKPYQGLEPLNDLMPGSTPLQYLFVKRRDRRGKPDAGRWEAIEELIKQEVDRMRGWSKGCRHTGRTLKLSTCLHLTDFVPPTPPAPPSFSDGPSGWQKEMPTMPEEEEPEPTSPTSPVLLKSLFVRETRDQTLIPQHDPAAETARPPDGAETTRSLYHAKAGFLCEHIECHPSELYTLEDKVGEGSFGSVRRAICKRTSGPCAIKALPKMLLESFSLWSEIAIMRQVDHPHLMRLYATFEDQHNIYMICELCTGGQLFDAIIEAGTICENYSARMMKQMLGAVCYLHQRHICHRDLKPENFMLATKGPLDEAHIKLIDFGTAKRFDLDDMTTKVCTVHYVAPELLKNQPIPYSEKCDVWSAGVILYTMLSGSPPFVGDDDLEVLKKVKKGKIEFRPKAVWDFISQDAQLMVRRMLTVRVSERCTAEQATNDSWVWKLAPSVKAPESMTQKVLGKMRSFHAYNKLKKVALQVIAQQLSDESIKSLRSTFLELDKDNRGALTIPCVKDAIQKLSCDEPRRSELIQTLSEMAGAAGEINYTQFLAANMDRQYYLREEACKAAFALFDVDNDGMITAADLEAVLSHGEEEEAEGPVKPEVMAARKFMGVDKAEIQAIMAECDEDKDGKIDFQEFIKMMGRASVSSDDLPDSKSRLSDAMLDGINRAVLVAASPTQVEKTPRFEPTPPSEPRTSTARPPKKSQTLTKSPTVLFGKGLSGGMTHKRSSGSMDESPADRRLSTGSADTDAQNPLWEVLKAHTVDMVRLRQVLAGEGRRFVNSYLDRDAGVPPPLFLAVFTRSPELVELLIDARADVRKKFEGAKPWKNLKKGQTPQDVNTSQKGRFIGTMIYDRCEAIETLVKAEEDRLRGWRSGRRASTAAKRYFAQASTQTLEAKDLVVIQQDAEESDGANGGEEDGQPAVTKSDSTEAALSKKTLYKTEATIMCQHINGDPLEAYQVVEPVGQGTFGSVSRVQDRTANTRAVMKTVPKSVLEESGLWQEIELLRDIDHPHIARLHGTYEDSESIYMILESCNGGEVFDLVEKKGAINEPAACTIIKQMLAATCYLHQKMICHRDLKTENFLLSRDASDEASLCIKLIDFRTARRFDPEELMTTKVCTIQYVAPEILARAEDKYSEKCDLWSLGVCAFLMLSGSLPFWGDTDTQILKKVRKGRFKFEPEGAWGTQSDTARGFITSLLVVDPGARPSARQALDHGWFEMHTRSSASAASVRRAIPKLLKFQSHSWFMQRSLQLVASQMAGSALEDIRAVWLEFDTSYRGTVGSEEVMRAVPPSTSDDPEFATARSKLLQSMSDPANDYRRVTYTSFLAAMMDVDSLDMAACASAFKLLDIDDDGAIRWSELALIDQAEREQEGQDWSLEIGKTGSTVEDKAINMADSSLIEECEQLIQKFDNDGDNALKLSDWVRMLRNGGPS